MGIYLKELSPIEGAEGNLMMTMLIEQSFRTKSVYFEAYESDQDWKLYWNYEIRPEEFLPIMREYAQPQITFSAAMADPRIQSKIKECSHTYSKQLKEEEVALIKKAIETGFPEITRQKPQGFDGHSYTFYIGGNDTEHWCWCVIPKEWGHISPVIDLFADIADLADNYRINGIG